MLCEKNGSRGTLFEYELMHNFHYFFLYVPLTHPLGVASAPPITSPARRITRRRGVGGCIHGLYFTFFFFARCSAVVMECEVEWVRGSSARSDAGGRGRASRPSVFEMGPSIPIKLFTKLPALSELVQVGCTQCMSHPSIQSICLPLHIYLTFIWSQEVCLNCVFM
jgi:hypothetical protein